ncbi:MAG: hypothetical protein HOK57_10090 [Planctomycetaceae bacterium]|jgi:hypothetical protein|nr:hypothetical protein [Bacteroidetes Order II. bacterium]MBT6460162.1 hypothetical protein [Planctomycetaceae bacterium]
MTEVTVELLLDMMEHYGVPSPDSYTAEEIADACPDIPFDFIKEHVKNR